MKMLKVRCKRIMAGILCTSLLVSECAFIGFHSYAAETEPVAETELIEESEMEEPETGSEEKAETEDSTIKEEQENPASGDEGANSEKEPETEEPEGDSAEEGADQKEEGMPSVSENSEITEEVGVTGEDYALTTAADDIASGVVDESYGHIEWVIDKNGKLTVSGWGDFAPSLDRGERRAPWDSYRMSIKTVEVDVTGMTNGSCMFMGCENMTTSNLIHFDTSKMTDASFMFQWCSSLDIIDLSNLDTGNVKDMSFMFNHCDSLSGINLRDLDTNSVTNMSGMFAWCSNLTNIDLSSFNTANVVDMSNMFQDCSELTEIDLSSFDTSNVTDMSVMFGKCSSLTTIDLSGFDTSKVIDMRTMFNGCSNLVSINLDGMDTSSVTYMRLMFCGCSRLNSIDLSSFDTNNVIWMENMFEGCDSLTSIDLSGFSISSVTDMSGMFSECNNLTTIYSPYNVTTTCILPTDSDDLWYRSDGTTVTELPQNLSYSVALGKNFIPTEKEEGIYIDEESKHKYKLFDESMEWEKAKEYCEGLGGHLVTITSEEEQEFVTAIAEKSKKKNIWLGAEMISGEFFWTTGENFVYTNWNSHEPNNVTNNQNTIMMYTYYGTNNDGYSIIPGVWNDESKQGRDWFGYTVDDTGFICEWDDELSEDEENSILVFTTEKTLSVKSGDSMWLAFALLDRETGLYDDKWTKMSVVVSDNSVIGLLDYEKTEYGYSLEVIGKKEGTTNVVVTDTSSGANLTIQINVYDEYVQTYSYSIDNMPSFYPDNKYEEKIQTNIYNLNGIYVNNYSVQKDNKANKYKVSFDAYNSNQYYGAVDIYDKDGNWIDYEEIEKFSNMTSLWDTGEQLYYLISNLVNGKLLTYEQASFSKCTPTISFEVPEDGYFIISNNVAASPGTFFSNAFDILFDASSTALDLVLSDSVKDTAFDDFMDGNKKILMERMVDVLLDKAEQNEELQKVFLKSVESKIRETTKKVAKADMNSLITSSNDMYSELANLAEDTMNRLKVGNEDGWKQQFKMATGIGESAFDKLAGPAGIALKGCFSINKGSDKLLMAMQMALSTDNTYVKVFSFTEDCSINQNGVIINSSGNVDSEAVLQVFRISNSDAIEVVLDRNNPLERYELYNICFVKNDHLVQPNGKVTVYLPIPDGMNGNTCKVYRQEKDSSWAILDAHIEGNYLVFETEHFSLYSIVGETKKISIYAMPTNTIYHSGDTLNSEGLIISVDDNLITKGFICTPTVLAGSGAKIITVIYGCATTEFEVMVKLANLDNPSGDVIEDDIPSDGIIPDGIWAAGIGNCTYTGKNITQTFRLYDGKKRLQEKTDYTVSYKNNKSAYIYSEEDYKAFEENLQKTGKLVKTGSFDPGKAPQAVIQMKGNYTGNKIVYFRIEPVDLSEDAFEADNLTITYTGKKQTPVPKLMWNGKALKYGTDFYVPEYDSTKSDKNAFKKSQTYTLTLTGKQNFAGERPITFMISQSKKQIAMDKVTVNGIKKVPWTGKQITQPSFTVKYKNITLSAENGDYTIHWGNNTDVGTGMVTLVGTGEDRDGDGFSFIGTKKVSFQITGNAMNRVSVSGVEKKYTYTGNAIEPSAKLTYMSNKNANAVTLTEGIHYTVTYQKNVDKGSATILFTGLASGGYSGTKKLSFSIVSSEIGNTSGGTGLQIAFGDSANVKNGVYNAPYMKGGTKPEVIVTFGEKTLTEGKDYKIKYTNNRKAALSTDTKAPTVIVTGKGNYKGTKSVKFSILAKALSNENGIAVIAKDKIAGTRANGYRQAFKVYDADGKALGSGDYDSKNVIYTLVQTKNNDGTVSEENRILDKNSVVPADSVVQITVRGKGVYAGGEATGCYRILKKNCDIGKATILIKNQSYTGSPVLITEQSQFTAGKVFIKIGSEKRELLLGEDMEVVPGSYIKNINRGTAKVTFRGIHDYGGTKTVSFKIGTRSVGDFWKGVFEGVSDLQSWFLNGNTI